MSKRGRGPRPLAATVADITKPVFGSRGFADGAIVKDWPIIVGAHLGTHSAPEKITYPSADHLGGTLRLRVDSGGLATELQHLGPVVVDRINGYFGYKAIAHLALVNGPVPTRDNAGGSPVRPLDADEEVRLAEILDSVEDTDLRAGLEALGRSVMGRKKHPRGA